MFMRFVGGGIGHKVTDYVQQRSPICIHYEEPELPDEDVIPHSTPAYAQAEEGDDEDRGAEEVDPNGDPEEVDANRGPEEVDTDEEADYGYVDDHKSEGGDSKSGDSKSEEGNDKDNNEVL